MEIARMEPGIYPSLANAHYHRSEGISKSGLDLIGVKNPASYKRRYLEDHEDEPTAAMIVGSATHTLVFEPDQFDKEFVVEPEFNRRTKQGRADALKFAEENTDKRILTFDDFKKADAIATAVINHPTVGRILANGEAETSYYARDPETGLLVKVRPDWESEDTLYDLKTCQDASEEDFSKTIYNRRYYVQAAMYRHIVNLAQKEKFGEERIKNFVFIAVEKAEPYQVAIYVCDEEMLFHGLEEYRRALRKYQQCLEADHWPGYNDDQIVSISLPVWAENRLNRKLLQ